jgi:hypothetical protein
VKNRPLSNGFDGGADYVLIPTVLKNTFDTNSIFTVQNVDVDAADITLTFVPTTGASFDVVESDVPSNSAVYLDMGADTRITSASFNGSVQVRSVKANTTTAGKVVATSLELSTKSNASYAFEGAMESASTIYMPSAFCKFGTGGAINSAYAVQNTGTDPVDVTVTWSSGETDQVTGLVGGAKASFPGCGLDSANPTYASGFIGSAKIEAPGGTIVAVGKIGGNGLSTAFLGFPSGASIVALPYIRWTETNWFNGKGQQANIAIQNVGSADLAAGDVVVHYFDKDGNEVGSDSLGEIAIGAKVNSNPTKIGVTEFGFYNGAYGGAAIVEGPAGSELAVVVRIATYIGGGQSVGEDYSGIEISSMPVVAQ